MRTTINLDDEIYELASVYASARGVTLGTAIGDLVRRSHMSASDEFESRIRIGANGIPVIPASGRAITPEMVKAFQEDELG